MATGLNPQTSCKTSFYQFTLSAAGQPSGLTQLPVRTLPGLPTALAASADGHLVAYSVTNCYSGASGQIGSGQTTGGIGLINLAAGQITRTWTYTPGEDYTSDLSMSADGSLLGYLNFISASSRAGRVLRASATSGSDQGASRVLIRQSDDDSAERERAAHVRDNWRPQPDPRGLRDSHRPAGQGAAPLTARPARPTLSPFVKGDHCVVVDSHRKAMCERVTPSRTSFTSINLASGRVTTLPFTETGPAFWAMAAW